MKKIVLLIEAIFIVMVLTACGSDKKSDEIKDKVSSGADTTTVQTDSFVEQTDTGEKDGIDLVYTFKDPSKPVAFDYPNFKSIEEGTSQVFKNSEYVIVYCRDSINTELNNVINELKEKFKNATRTHIEGTCDSFDIVTSEKKEINGIEMLLVNGSLIAKYDDNSTIKLPLHGYTFAKGDTVYELIAVLNDESNNSGQEEMENILDAMIATLREAR